MLDPPTLSVLNAPAQKETTQLAVVPVLSTLSMDPFQLPEESVRLTIPWLARSTTVSLLRLYMSMPR